MKAKLKKNTNSLIQTLPVTVTKKLTYTSISVYTLYIRTTKHS